MRREPGIVLALALILGLAPASAARAATYPRGTSPPLVEAGPGGHLLALHEFQGAAGYSFATPGRPLSRPAAQSQLIGTDALALDGSGTATRLASGGESVLAQTAMPGRVFAEPRLVGPSDALTKPVLAVDRAGAAVAAWIRARRLLVAVRGPGAAFAPPRDLGPVTGIAGVVLTPQGAARLLVTTAATELPDPSAPTDAALVTLEPDGAARTDVLARGATGGALSQAADGRLLAVLRGPGRELRSTLIEPGGRRGPLITVAGEAFGASATVLGAVLDRDGRAAVAWTYPTDFGPVDVHVAEGRAETGYGPARRLDRPDRVAEGSRAFFAANLRGDAVVTWSAAVSRPRASFRPAGGRFGSPRVLSAAAGSTPTAAMLPDGQAVLGWTDERDPRPRQVVRRMGAAGLGRARTLARLASRAAAIDPRARARCRAARSGVLARTRYAVLRRFGRSGRAREREVCSLLTGHSASFTDEQYGDFLDTIRLAGRLVAWGTVAGNDQGPSASAYAAVSVRDSRTGDRVGPLGIDKLGNDVVLTDLVLARDGAVAAVTCRAVRDIYDVDRPTAVARRRCSRPGRPTTVVVADAHGGDERVVDRGRSIDPRSLELRGRRVTWRQGGRTRSVVLRRIRLPD